MILTIGTTGNSSDDVLAYLRWHPEIVVLDTRTPDSRWVANPRLGPGALRFAFWDGTEGSWEKRYKWLPELADDWDKTGTESTKPDPILKRGFDIVSKVLSDGKTPLLLCTHRLADCHRLRIAQKFAKLLGDRAAEVDLKTGGFLGAARQLVLL